jgi:hypothetical protein
MAFGGKKAPPFGAKKLKKQTRQATALMGGAKLNKRGNPARTPAQRAIGVKVGASKKVRVPGGRKRRK